MNHSSRQRMIAALDRQPVGTPPCSFMAFGGLWQVSANYPSFIRSQLDLGLDATVQITLESGRAAGDQESLPGPPVDPTPAVQSQVWIDEVPEEKLPLIVREYHTPASRLRSEVVLDEDWRWTDQVVLSGEYLSLHTRRFLVEKPADLEKAAHLLGPPSPAALRAFQRAARSAVDLARRHDLLLVGGWGVGADMIAWLYGPEQMLYAIYDAPDFVKEFLAVVAEWNRARMQAVLKTGVDLYIKRAVYENCDYWTPQSYRKFLAPTLKAEVDLAHSHGARFGYFIPTNCIPLLETIAECGVDVLLGADPLEWNMAETHRILAGKISLWGGVNASSTIAQGSVAEVRHQVRRALELLSGDGGFILSPVGDVRALADRQRRNVLALIDEWRRHTRQGD